jgi:transcriptional regulator with XRE-family HTH domain
MEHTETPRTVHQGRNVKRFREMLGIKQEALADQLGGDWSQKKISLVEAKETIEPGLLDELAKALKVPSEAIRNFSEEAIFNIVNNTFHDFHDHAQASALNYHCTFNPIDKIVELYEALLKSEREKVAMLERMLQSKK